MTKLTFIKALLMVGSLTLPTSSFAQSQENCDRYRFQDDYDRCVERNRKLAEQEEDREERTQRIQEDRATEQSRQKKYITLTKGPSEPAKGINRRALQTLLDNGDVNFDSSNDWSNCKPLVNPYSLPEVYSSQLANISGGLTMADLQTVAFAGVTKPLPSGKPYSDNETEKSPMQNLLETAQNSESGDNLLSTEKTLLEQIKRRYQVTAAHFQKAAPVSTDALLPRTTEERESYLKYLAANKGNFQNAMRWSEIEYLWANQFFQERLEEARDRLEYKMFCRYFKQNYVTPYEETPNGMNADVGQLLLMNMTFVWADRCNLSQGPNGVYFKGQEDQAYIDAKKNARDNFVAGVNKDLKRFRLFTTRQIMLSSSGDQQQDSTSNVLEVLNSIQSCLNDEISMVQGSSPSQ